MLGRIAIHLNNDNTCSRRIDVGLQLAKEHNAEVIGVYPANGVAAHYYDESIIPQDVRKILRGRREEFRDSVQKMFTERAEAAGVKHSFRTPAGEADEALALHARYCDLLIMSKAEQVDTVTAIIANLPESVVMASGRPVLMIPNAGRIESIGQRVLYCWDQRREAARAFSDAAPFLKDCKELTVLEIDRDERIFREFDLRENDFASFCTGRGYPQPKHLVKKSDDIGVGNVILNTASDVGSDLIVMGAYGHSRMRQWVMGGASRTLLSSMTVPVLLAH
ncbi:MAG TPA: universal stress protein [Burkholderiaceae bacterium]|nr:universal stress protein [Burkholderiaceae bacterium]